jgi:hypothetical protein
MRLELNDAVRSRIPPATLAAVDSVAAQLRAGTFSPLPAHRDTVAAPAP